MLIQKIEDLVVWQEARSLAKLVYLELKDFPKLEEYNLVKHMRECSRSVPANIAEGFGRFSYQDSMQFYRIARGSLYELKSDVYISFDNSYIKEATLKEIINQIDKVGMLLNGFIKSTYEAKLKKLNNQ